MHKHFIIHKAFLWEYNYFVTYCTLFPINPLVFISHAQFFFFQQMRTLKFREFKWLAQVPTAFLYQVSPRFTHIENSNNSKDAPKTVGRLRRQSKQSVPERYSQSSRAGMEMRKGGNSFPLVHEWGGPNPHWGEGYLQSFLENVHLSWVHG